MTTVFESSARSDHYGSAAALPPINIPNPLPYRCSLPAKAAYDHGAGIVYSAPQRLAVAERFQVSDELLGMRWVW